MPLRISIPESDRIRQLAAALVTAKSHGRVTEAAGLDFGQTVRLYFRRLPWSGKRAVKVDLALDMSLVTVGQYFMSMDWDGLSGPVEVVSKPHSESSIAREMSDVGENLMTPTETVSLDGFFTDYFGN